MSFTTVTDTERKNISVWFECKCCQLTFPFRTVAEFLDHKKQKHFAQFQKAQCIVFEERLQDELATNYSDQDSETKLFAQDDDVELCTGSRMGEFVSGIADPSSLKTVPLPVPVLVPFPVPNQVQPPPLNLSHKDHSNTAIQTTNASALREKTRQEYELNADFGLFSVCLPSVYTSRVSDPCDLQADQILNDSTQTVEAHHLAYMLVDDENNSAIISPDRLSPDFSFVDDHDEKIDVPIEVDVPSNVENTNNRNSTSPNPYVLLGRLSAKELSASNRNCNLKNTLKSFENLKCSKPTLPKIEILLGPFACTICSKSCKTKSALGRHMDTHYDFKRRPRRYNCSYPGCTYSFDYKYMLKPHIERHESALKNASFKFPLPDSDTLLTKVDPLTLREWLIQQKLTSEKYGNSSKETETVNIIRLDPDPTEMDEATDKAFKISVETPIQCKLCRKNLESEVEVKVHVMHCWLRNKRRHCYCAPCNKTFYSPQILKTHTKALHAVGINIPSKCDRPRPPKLERKCHICLRPFYKLSSLKSHMISHKNKEEREREASFVCEICGKAYINNNVLARHIVAHGEDRPFKCSYPNCTATFKFNNYLKDHLKTHLPKPQNVPKLICCPKEGCSKRFRTKKILRDHLKSIRHTGVPVPKSWKCDQENCDKLYRLKVSWDRHRIAAHGVGGELPTFQCHICSKTFTWKLSLIAHLQSHTEERPFKCSYDGDGCDKAFKHIKSLHEHIRGEHTGERPFQCELCGKAYHRTL